MTTEARPRRPRWAIRIALAVAVLAVLGAAALFVLMHATAGSRVVVRNATDGPVCDVVLDPDVVGRTPTTIDRLAPHDTRGVEIALGPLDTGILAVRYRRCGSEGAPIESASVDPGRTIVLDGAGVRAGPMVRHDEE